LGPGGDVVYVRVGFAGQFGGKAAAVLTVGQAEIRFEVTTKK